MRRIAARPLWLLAALPPLFWAGNFVLARALHMDIPPIALSFWRWAIALLILLPFAWPGLHAQWRMLLRHWPVLTLLAILGVANYNSFAYLGLQETSATNAVLLSSATPVIIVALSFLLLRQKVGLAQLLGILLSLAGVVMIATEGRPRLFADITLNQGDLWILAASLDWALYSVCLRWRPAELEPLTFLAAIMGIGLIPLIGLYAWDLAQGHRFALSLTNLGAIGYVALFPSILAYIFWNRAIQEMGANRTGQYMHLVPAFGALLATLLLGEQLLWFHAAGGGLIALGIVLATLTRRGI